MTRKRCVICGRAITETFYVCIHCCKEHGVPYKYQFWPRWLKDLVNMEIKNLVILRIEEGHLSFCVSAKEEFDDDKGNVDSIGHMRYEDIVMIF